MISSKNSRRSAEETPASMINLTCIIGQQSGMEHVVSSTTAHSKVVLFFTDLAAFLSASDLSPDLILVLQHSPDEYTNIEVEELLGKFPVARCVCCYGVWCVSMGRNRSAWPPACIVPQADFDVRLSREHEVLSGSRPALPVTAGLDELFGFMFGA